MRRLLPAPRRQALRKARPRKVLAGQPWGGSGGGIHRVRTAVALAAVIIIGKPYGDLALGAGAALAPIESLEGIITPSSLQTCAVTAAQTSIQSSTRCSCTAGGTGSHVLNGIAVELSDDHAHRFPGCSGNSNRASHLNPLQVPAVRSRNISCSEWTGIRLRILLEEAGMQPEAKWLVAEGPIRRMSRSIPVEKALVTH